MRGGRSSLGCSLRLAAIGAVCGAPLAAQSPTIRLTSDAPVSAGARFPEEAIPANQLLRGFPSTELWTLNVSEPTLTVYRADPAKANGTAVVVAPGGGFHFLAVQGEGDPIARWLAERGVTAFVLKYRTIPLTAEHRREFFSQLSPLAHLDPEIPGILPLEVADARAALSYVRAHAAEYGIAPNRVGLLGASAGAMVAVPLALDGNPVKPDFLALLYSGMHAAMKPLNVTATTPPAFIVVASDDALVGASPSIELYSAWIAAGRPIELHAYAAGNHGFGMATQNLPVDTWPARLEDWLRAQGLLTPPK